MQKKCACLAEKDLAINMLAEINYGHSHRDNDYIIDISTDKISNINEEDSVLLLTGTKSSSKSESILKNTPVPSINEKKYDKYLNEFLLFDAFTVRNFLVTFCIIVLFKFSCFCMISVRNSN